MSAALLMPREPVHGCVCFGQTSQRLLDFLSRGVSALDVPDHLLPQPREPFRAIYIAVSRSFKVEGREPHGRRFRLSSSRNSRIRLSFRCPTLPSQKLAGRPRRMSRIPAKREIVR
jgi:hypothetical protein